MFNFLLPLRRFFQRSSSPAPESRPEPEPRTEQECYFLNRLPPELRIQIYKLVFSRDTIHLLHNKGRISHIRTPPPARLRSGKLIVRYTRCPINIPHISSLLLTCRQIHKEAAPLFYSTPIFRVSLQETWNLFAKHIGPENLSNVRSLWAPAYPQTQLSFGQACGNGRGQSRAGDLSADSYREDEKKVYDEFYDVLATKMVGLRVLMLVLVSLPEGMARSREAEWHAPLRRMRGLQRFLLEIRNETDAEAGDTKELIRFLEKTICAPREDAK
ncbi:hypothetical protein AJ79_04302 [Helicocarpus griseus UAMH5409]|uniref:DUF7730 domain-containing protein n=1 Tax=Helicocarpus griseus UAMH5409 TaxID=1447875 RepID=A0A2B7XU49_9EURO|nr:hypothetical protein AJ79_04302 [Helicocarpus griseus UAMH5409]